MSTRLFVVRFVNDGLNISRPSCRTCYRSRNNSQAFGELNQTPTVDRTPKKPRVVATREKNRRRHHHDQRVLNTELPSPPGSTGRHSNHSTPRDEFGKLPAIFISYVVAAVKSWKLDLDDTISMDSTSFWAVCLYDNHKSLQYQERKHIASFIRTGIRNFSYWRNR